MVGMAGFLSSPIEVSRQHHKAWRRICSSFPFSKMTIRAPSQALDAATGGEWSRALAACELTGKPFESWWRRFETGGPPAGHVLGAGSAARFTHETAGRLGAAAALLARQRRVTRIALVLDVGSTGGGCRDRPTGWCRRPPRGLCSGSWNRPCTSPVPKPGVGWKRLDIVMRRVEHTAASSSSRARAHAGRVCERRADARQ